MRGWMRRADGFGRERNNKTDSNNKKHSFTHAQPTGKKEEQIHSLKRTAESKGGKRRRSREKKENTNEINNPEIMIYPH